MTGQIESKVFVIVLFYLLLSHLSICFILFSETFSILFFPLFSSPTGEEVWTARPLKSHYFSIVQ